MLVRDQHSSLLDPFVSYKKLIFVKMHPEAIFLVVSNLSVNEL
jgi:hypothetical protein